MTVLDCTLFSSYAEVNEFFELSGAAALSNDRNVEDPAFIVYVYKWTWDGGDPDGPDVSFLGVDIAEHVRLHSKVDLFICTAA